MKRYLVVITTAIFVISAACGSSTEQAEPTTPGGGEGEEPPPAETTETEAPPEAPPLGAWDSLDTEGRRALMVEQVMPEMGSAFREHDGEEFVEFTCATCHMSNFQEVNFQMPNGLAPLNPADVPNLASSSDEDVVRTAQFMFQQVTPGMIRILGVEPYNQETQQGFRCLTCHATAE